MTTTQIFAADNSRANKGKDNNNGIIWHIEAPKSNESFNNPQKIKKEHTVAPQFQKTVAPLKIIVKNIEGNNEDDYYAVIEFEGEEMTVRKDQIVEGKFKVIDIFSDRIVVYSNREQRRHTYKISK